MTDGLKRYGVEGGSGTGGQHLPFARAVQARMDGCSYRARCRWSMAR